MSALARLLAVLAWRREEAGPPPAPPPAHPAVLVHVIGYPPASRPAVAAGGVQASAGGAAPPRPPAPAQRPPADALGALAEALLSEAADPLTPRDRERLRGVHPHLVRVVERAARSERLMVIEGLRTRDRQAALVASGASRTMDSRHLTGHAAPRPSGGRSRERARHERGSEARDDRGRSAHRAARGAQ